jgi:hypothetical protein
MMIVAAVTLAALMSFELHPEPNLGAYQGASVTDEIELVVGRVP